MPSSIVLAQPKTKALFRKYLFFVILLMFPVMGYSGVLEDSLQSGIDALNAGNYTRATTEFGRAYSLAPEGTYLKEKSQFYLIKSFMKAGDEKRNIMIGSFLYHTDSDFIKVK